jgi:hypothetical protein
LGLDLKDEKRNENCKSFLRKWGEEREQCECKEREKRR